MENNFPTKIGVTSQEGLISLGNWKVSLKNGETDLYYNIDLGSNSKDFFNSDLKRYEDHRNLHWSFHHSGEGHLKQKKGPLKIFEGQLSDQSNLISLEPDILILGIESIFPNRAPLTRKENLTILTPEYFLERYSILWMLVPDTFPDVLPHRLLWVNLWDQKPKANTVRTASLSDILISFKTQAILKMNGWCLRACFIKKILPVLENGGQDIIIVHPRGKELPWRAFVFIDVHLPLSEMIKSSGVNKQPIIVPYRPFSSYYAPHPSAWIKFAD